MSVWGKAGISHASGAVLTSTKLCGEEGAHDGSEHGEGQKRNGLKPGTALQNKVEQRLKDGCKSLQTETAQSRDSPAHTPRQGYQQAAHTICGQHLASTKGNVHPACNPKRNGS